MCLLLKCWVMLSLVLSKVIGRIWNSRNDLKKRKTKVSRQFIILQFRHALKHCVCSRLPVTCSMFDAKCLMQSMVWQSVSAMLCLSDHLSIKCMSSMGQADDMTALYHLALQLIGAFSNCDAHAVSAILSWCTLLQS